MATNARKQTIPSGSDTTVSRATIFEIFGNSIRDVVPVASTTERTQLVTALTSAGQAPSATKPLVVTRADAPGTRRIEYTLDGTLWFSASGQLDFASKTAADSFGTANPGLLTLGDKAMVAGFEYIWTASGWAGAAVLITPDSAVWRFDLTGVLPGAVRREGNRNYLQGAFTNAQVGGTSVTQNQDYRIGSIPSAMAPPFDVFFTTSSANGTAAANVSVKSNGDIYFTPRFGGTFPNGGLVTYLDGYNWPVK
jgi:hypothetical protein